MADQDESSLARQVLDPIDRYSEVMFGLLMTLTFTGTMSVTLGEGGSVNSILAAALGCNIAWGIVDAVMLLLRNATDRRRALVQRKAILQASPAQARQMVRELITGDAGETLEDHEADVVVGWIGRQAGFRGKRMLRPADFRAAVAVFFLVVLATVPPVLPFLLTEEVILAMRLSNAVALATLFFIGWRLDQHIEGGSRIMRFVVPVVGALLVAATIALGG